MLAIGTLKKAARSEDPLVQHLGEIDPDRPPPLAKRILKAGDWASPKIVPVLETPIGFKHFVPKQVQHCG